MSELAHHEAALRIQAPQLALALAAREVTAQRPDTTLLHCLRGALAGGHTIEMLSSLIGWGQDEPIRLLGFRQVLAEVAPALDLDVLGHIDPAVRADFRTGTGALFVHRNTVKYRLVRPQELADIDLDDPLTRFACEVQMPLLYDF